MCKAISLLSMAALCGFALFEHTPTATTATIRLVLAVVFSYGFAFAVKESLEDLLG
jgi:hypothetical protein